MSNEWILESKELGTVRITSRLIERLKSYRQLSHNSLESGGILLGSFLNSGGNLIIDQFTPPQSDDKQTRYSHYRSKTHSKIAQDRWFETEGHTTFLGLWHTHPEPIPHESAIDISDWKKTLRNSVYEGQHLFFIIVGQSHIRCWLGSKGTLIPKINLIGEYEIDKNDME